MNRDPVAGGRGWTRREFLGLAAAAGVLATAGPSALRSLSQSLRREPVFVGRASGYGGDLRGVLLDGLASIGVEPSEVRGRRVFLKPNLVEPHREHEHVNVHPLFLRAAVEAFLHLGAASVTVGEGAGHRRDTEAVLYESGLAEVLAEDRIRFIDLNLAPVARRSNLGGTMKVDHLWFPAELLASDIVVSVAKMKTHHWAGVTLTMKNLFGAMPGIVYGWPKNLLHWQGLHQSIHDITATLRPHLGLVDGIVGMEGDGPIMGDPVAAGVVVVGRDLVATDATAARVMGIDPWKIPSLAHAGRFGGYGVVAEARIDQRGEVLASVRRDFRLLDVVPAHRGIRIAG